MYPAGTRVRIVGNSNGSCNEIGDIGVVAIGKLWGMGEAAKNSVQVEVQGRGRICNWTRPCDMVVADPLTEKDYEDVL